jgi:hypothetical protein
VFVLPNSTSNEIREKIIHHKQNYVNETDNNQLACNKPKYGHKNMGVTQKNRNHKTKTSRTRQKTPCNTANHESNHQKIEQTPDIILKELIVEFNLPISSVTLSK